MRTKSDEKIKEIKRCIESFYEANDRSPSVREISETVGMSKSNVQRYLISMTEDGILERNKDGYGTELTTMIGSQTVNVPKIGYVPCGPLAEEVECIEGYLKLPLAFLGDTRKAFLLSACGNSMIGAGIDDGDLVLVKQQETADDGDIIVALVENEVTLKRYYNEPSKHRVRLHPENPIMKDIFVKDLIIQGVAIKVIKDL